MTEDELRAELAAALPGILRNPVGKSMRPLSEIADALLPVVRRYAARQLRDAAEESTYWVMTRETVYTRLNEHADALEADR